LPPILACQGGPSIMFSRPHALVRCLSLSLLSLLIGLTAVGCSKGLAEVSGKVTYNKAPLDNASIQFQGSDGGFYATETGSDGTYTIKVPVGEAKVVISAADNAAAQKNRQK